MSSLAEEKVRAREQWTQAKAQGFEASYWQPDESGRWVQKA